MAAGPPAVEVNSQIGASQLVRERLERLRVNHVVDRPGEEGERTQNGGGGEDEPVLREGRAKSPQGRDAREEVAEAKGPERDEKRPLRYGHDDSRAGVTTSSRTSQPGGWSSTKSTAAATSSGRLSCVSGGGR